MPISAVADFNPKVGLWVKLVCAFFLLGSAWYLIDDYMEAPGYIWLLLGAPMGLVWLIEKKEPRLTARANGFTVDREAKEIIEWDRLVTVAAAPTTPQTVEFFKGYIEYQAEGQAKRVRFGWQRKRKNAAALVAFLGEACFHLGERLLQDGEAQLGRLTYSKKDFFADVDGTKVKIQPQHILTGERHLEFLVEDGTASAWKLMDGKPLVYLGSHLMVTEDTHFTKLWQSKLKAPNVLPHLSNISRILEVPFPQVPARPSL